MNTAPSLKEGLFKLAGLSTVESEISYLKNRIEEIPKNFNEMRKKLEELEMSFSEKKSLCEEAESQLKKIEASLNEFREQIKTREARLYEIKTTKEYQAAIKEIATTKKQNIDRENQTLQLMEKVEALKKELAPFEGEITTLQNKVKEEGGKIFKELEEANSELKEKLVIKEQLFGSLDKILVTRYERVLLRRQPAVAAVRSGICQECHMNVPPQLYIEIQKCLEIIGCPSCNRILYIPLDS